MEKYLPVDVFARISRMIRLKGFPQAGALAFDIQGKLDRDRLATALGIVIQKQHPVVGCRICRYLGIFYRWKKVPFDPANYFLGPFEELRDFDAFREPPLRIHLGEDNITFETSHVALDGIGLLRVILSIMEQYASLPRTLPSLLDEEMLRRTGSYWGPKPRKYRRSSGRRFLDPERGKILSTRADSVFQTGEPNMPGTLLEHITLPLPRVKEHARSLGCTINELYVGALLTQIIRWNTGKDHPARYLSVDVPVNLRPRKRSLELAANASGNFTINILNLKEDKCGLVEMTGRVSDEFNQAWKENRQWTGIRKRSTLRYPTEFAVFLGRLLLGRLSKWLQRFAPTAIVSNMGRVPGLEGDFAGVRIENARTIGTAFAPLALNTCSPNSETCLLSFSVRKSHFRPETLAKFASETGKLIVEGE